MAGKRKGKRTGKKSCNSCSTTNQFIPYSVIIGAVVSLILMVIHFFTGNKHTEGFSLSEPTLYLFHSTQCGHCTKMMPQWDALEKNNNSGVRVKKIEKDDTSEEAIDMKKKCKDKVQGYPTILYVDEKKNIIEPYEGERKKEAMESFCKQKQKP